MNYPNMGMMPPPVQGIQMNQQLVIEIDPTTYQFNKTKVNGLYFGQMEPLVNTMLDEMNVIVAKFRDEARNMICCTFLFLCFPCILCLYIIPKSAKINREFQGSINAVIAKNKQSLESAGFSCSLVTQSVANRRQRGAHVQYTLEFQKYSNVGMVQNPMPNYGQGGYPQAYPQAFPQQEYPQGYQQPPYQ